MKQVIVLSAAANPFLNADGMLNLEKVIELNKTVKGRVAKDVKPSRIFVIAARAKPIKYSATLEKKEDLRYMGRRATKVAERKRLSEEAMTRVKVVLTDYQGTDGWAALTAAQQTQVKDAIKAITSHSKKIEKVKTKVGNLRTKAREKLNSQFDDTLGLFMEELKQTGIKDTNIVDAKGAFGRTVLIKVGPDNVIAVSPADMARFRAAKRDLTSTSSGMVSLSGLEPWAAEMGKIVRKIMPKADLGLGGMGGQDGAAVEDDQIKALITAFTEAGYKTGKDKHSQFVYAKGGKDKGVAFFYYDPSDKSVGKVMQFFVEDMESKSVSEEDDGQDEEGRYFVVALNKAVGSKVTAADYEDWMEPNGGRGNLVDSAVRKLLGEAVYEKASTAARVPQVAAVKLGVQKHFGMSGNELRLAQKLLGDSKASTGA